MYGTIICSLFRTALKYNGKNGGDDQMSRRFLKTAAAATAFYFAGIAAFASETELNTVFDYNNNTVTVEIEADDAALASLTVLNKDIVYEDLTNGNENRGKFLYMKQLPVTEGKAVFVINYTDDTVPGLYNCRYMTDTLAKPVDGEPVFIVPGGIYQDAAGKLNGYAKDDNLTLFKDYIEKNYEKLGFDISLYNKLSQESSFSNYMTYVKANLLNVENCSEDIAAYRTFMMIGALNENTLENAHSLLLKSTITKTQVHSDYIKAFKDEQQQKYFTGKLSGQSISTIQQLEKAMKVSYILSSAYYADGYEDVKNALLKYGSEIGITDTAANSVYRAMCGKNYESGTTFAKAYDELKKNPPNDGSGTGGGGGGGAGGGAGGGGTPVKGDNRVNAGKFPDDEQSAAKPITAGFDDVEGVDWAIEAIVALADKGIINGKSDRIFDPNAPITREEFVKILTLACGYPEQTDKNYFTDVNANDWFFDVVNSAYEHKLVSGMGNGRFGVGQPISRQDMAVMIYNALKAKGGYALKSELSFEDTALIADYAAEAVMTLCEKGVMNGISGKMFDPAGSATRAQAAKVIYGVLNELQ